MNPNAPAAASSTVSVGCRRKDSRVVPTRVVSIDSSDHSVDRQHADGQRTGAHRAIAGPARPATACRACTARPAARTAASGRSAPRRRRAGSAGRCRCRDIGPRSARSRNGSQVISGDGAAIDGDHGQPQQRLDAAPRDRRRRRAITRDGERRHSRAAGCRRWRRRRGRGRRRRPPPSRPSLVAGRATPTTPAPAPAGAAR